SCSHGFPVSFSIGSQGGKRGPVLENFRHFSLPCSPFLPLLATIFPPVCALQTDTPCPHNPKNAGCPRFDFLLGSWVTFAFACGTVTPDCTLGFPFLRRPSNDLEGAPSFARLWREGWALTIQRRMLSVLPVLLLAFSGAPGSIFYLGLGFVFRSYLISALL